MEEHEIRFMSTENMERQDPLSTNSTFPILVSNIPSGYEDMVEMIMKSKSRGNVESFKYNTTDGTALVKLNNENGKHMYNTLRIII